MLGIWNFLTQIRPTDRPVYTDASGPIVEEWRRPIWNTIHNQEGDGKGVFSYVLSIANRTAVVCVPDRVTVATWKAYRNMEKFLLTARPGDYVYNNERSQENAENRVTHRGKWTGRVFTPDMTKESIKRLMEDTGVRFEEGVIGIGCMDPADSSLAPIYIELCEFEELEQVITGPAWEGHMIYEVTPRLDSCRKTILQTYHPDLLRFDDDFC